MAAVLDHLVFAANSLDEGAPWLEERLGIKLSKGGKHVAMGTHNLLLRLGERRYFELIAIDPEGESPSHLRWFDLNNFKCPKGEAQLVTWAASVPSLSSCQPSFDPGDIIPMSRGTLSWFITVRPDGLMPLGGVLPTLIEWPGGINPVLALPISPVTLEALELLVPDPKEAEAALASIELKPSANDISIGPSNNRPKLRAQLRTASGVVSFESA
jgi:hypothetical protein